MFIDHEFRRETSLHLIFGPLAWQILYCLSYFCIQLRIPRLSSTAGYFVFGQSSFFVRSTKYVSHQALRKTSVGIVFVCFTPSDTLGLEVRTFFFRNADGPPSAIVVYLAAFVPPRMFFVLYSMLGVVIWIRNCGLQARNLGRIFPVWTVVALDR